MWIIYVVLWWVEILERGGGRAECKLSDVDGGRLGATLDRIARGALIYECGSSVFVDDGCILCISGMK